MGRRARGIMMSIPNIQDHADWWCKTCILENDGLRTFCYSCKQSRKFAELQGGETFRGWRSLKSAPKNATWVWGKLASGEQVKMHWAEDLSGEEQPPFKGWYVRVGEGAAGYFSQVEPVAWLPLQESGE